MKPGLFSTPRRRTLLLAAVAVLAGLFFLWPRGPREPVYQGKTLTQWVMQADGQQRGLETQEARAALKAIGTNAVPFLLKDFTRPVSLWRMRLNERARQHPWIKFRLRNDYELIRVAGVGLQQLGPDAAPALPVVVRLLGDNIRGPDAGKIVQSAGEISVPHLCAAAASPDSTLASNAVAALWTRCYRDAMARQCVLLALQHRDAGVREAAVRSLSILPGKDVGIVDLLLKARNDPEARVYREMTNQLASLTRYAVPAIRTAASNALLTLRTNAPPPRAH